MASDVPPPDCRGCGWAILLSIVGFVVAVTMLTFGMLYLVHHYEAIAGVVSGHWLVWLVVALASLIAGIADVTHSKWDMLLAAIGALCLAVAIAAFITR